MKKLVKYKRYLDRGGVYFGYYSMVATSLILIKIFNIRGWYWYVIFILLIFILRFLAGFLDDRYVLRDEQRQLYEKNPVIEEINKKLDKLHNIENLLKNQKS